MRLLPTTAAQAMREQVQLLLERSLPACGNSGSTAVHQQVENGQHTSPTGVRTRHSRRHDNRLTPPGPTMRPTTISTTPQST